MPRAIATLAAAVLLLGAGKAVAGSPDAEHLYREHCASCHGPTRLGGTGPALLPESLGRLKKPAAAAVIAEGRDATQMPAFGDALAPDEIEALVALIYTPPAVPPTWSEADIEASRVVSLTPDRLVARPLFESDPLNLFVVVESGDHHVTILDGDRFEPLARFPSRYALHGGVKFSPEGRFAYMASRDGWITKYDLYGLATVAEVRAGLNTRNIAISHDGAIVAIANYLPNTLVMLDATDLRPLKVMPVKDFRGKSDSRVSAVYQAAPRASFIAALKDVPELWEIPYGADAKPVQSGFVHSHEVGMEEALSGSRGRFPVRRIQLSRPLDDFFFDVPYRHLFGSAREDGKVVVVHLDVGREIAEIAAGGMPHLGSGITWRYQGRPVMATPNLREGALTVIDMGDWSVVRRIETLGPGFFLRSHEASAYAWADVFFGENRDAVHVIDKRTLEIVKTLRPAPGKTAAHVEFTRDGRYALLSIWDMDGAIVVYDAATLKEVKRLPMVKPAGKYNVFNKITLSAGTSH